MSENKFKGIALETAGRIHSGEITSKEVVQHYLDRIKELNSRLNAFIRVCDNHALEMAEKTDERIQKGDIPSRLAGIPIAIKDNICTRGIKTTSASKMLENYEPPYNATVVNKLLDAGLILLGKTNLDEFAMGSSNETSFFGPVKNPHDSKRTPGGSSGGSATAVSSLMAPLSIATDCGGSIRQPSAFCGVYGLKPTYGLVSRYGLISFIPSTDQIGPITNSVDDASALLNIIAGYDQKDSNSLDVDIPDYLTFLKDDISDLRIGVVSEWLEEVDTHIKDSLDNTLKTLENKVRVIDEVKLPYSKYAIATYRLIADAETSSNMARYDGVNFGFRSENPENLLEMYRESRGQSLGDEVKRRIMIGTFILSHGYQEKYYRKALDAIKFIRDDFSKAFKDFDIILAPTTPTLPFKLGELIDDPLKLYFADVFVTPANLAGLPAMSIPVGTYNELPTGLQIIGNQLEEVKILQTAKFIEKECKIREKKS
jgi:aspartyl-tRNA(Asn)/glutamyl-tRNA(Gln) amidotransferase subunit A